MLENNLRLYAHIIFCVQLDRESGFFAPKEIANDHPHGIAGRLLVAPLIDPELLCLQRFQQANGNFLDPPDY